MFVDTSGVQDVPKTFMTLQNVIDTIAYKTGLRDRFRRKRFADNPYFAGLAGSKPWIDAWSLGWQDAGRLVKSAYGDGVGAKIRGVGVEACTFQDHTFGREAWLKGWRDTEVTPIQEPTGQ